MHIVKVVLKISLLILFNFLALGNLFSQGLPYQNKKLSRDIRIVDLISRLTLDEKIEELVHNAPGVPRLGIPQYNWWNEALHGVGRSGRATIFPQAIGLAATFNDKLALEEASIISDEARAIFNVSTKKDYRIQYAGLTFWTPNINIFRDPRWGRGQETYGEDPLLTSKIGVAFVKGLQGNNSNYLKVAACAKHFAVHSGPEKLRHEFNAVVSSKDLWETYLPAFKALVDSNVETVMCAYNRTNDQACCASNYLLKDVLIDKWKFKGHIVTDCGAVNDFYKGHNIVSNAVAAAALAIRSGINLECGSTFSSLKEAVEKKLITEQDIDGALTGLLSTKFKLGLFDPIGSTPYDTLSEKSIYTTAHRMVARKVAQQSIVLLKNNGVLPLKNDLKRYFVSGPNAASLEALMGNYYGVTGNYVTILEGITNAVSSASQISYRVGTPLVADTLKMNKFPVGEVKTADVTIVVLGITGFIEGEEGESILSQTGGDRLDYNLPSNQLAYLRALKKVSSKPLIVVVTGGSPMNLAEVHEIADAVVLVWYPGGEGGNAVADILFGTVSPAGRLPITFPQSLEQIPSYEDYSMKGRTYRFMSSIPMYPFGYGLSYASFNYSNLRLSTTNLDTVKSVEVRTTITNQSKIDADEVVQLYIAGPQTTVNAPFFSLKDFKRILIPAGSSKEIMFTLDPSSFKLVNEQGESVFVPGAFKVYVAGSLPTDRSKQLGASSYLSATVMIN